MGVVFECQSVMAYIVGCVMGTGHGAQGHHHHSFLFRTALDGAEQVVDALGHILAFYLLYLHTFGEPLGFLFFLAVLHRSRLHREVVAEETDKLA